MNIWIKRGLVCLYVIFATLQFRQTVNNSNNWPLCSYNMFNKIPAAYDVEMSRVKLTLDDGTSMVVKPGNILPIEFFRAPQLLNEAFVYSDDIQQQEDLARYVLRSLNEHPWSPFDEVYGAAPRPRSHKFIGFALMKYHYDVTDYGAGEPLSPTWIDEQYSYQPPGMGPLRH